ncbi:MAG: hypothetical protein WCD53_16930, partial [Microcoleus sp.]
SLDRRTYPFRLNESHTGNDIIATAKAVKAMRVIGPFDSAQGAMTLIALATAISVTFLCFLPSFLTVFCLRLLPFYVVISIPGTVSSSRERVM